MLNTINKIAISFASLFMFANASEINHLHFGIESTCDQIIERQAYISCINYDAKNPDWVAYITSKKLAKYYNKREDKFKEDKQIPIAYRSTLKDYKRSGYDRGHLMPNALADFSKKAQDESFILSNIVPQLAKHNRTIWKELEAKIRELARKEELLSIFTGVIYSPNHKNIGRGVAVPSYFYKVVLAPKSEKAFAFLIPHKKIKSTKNFKKYQVTIDEIEELTGNNYFSKLKPKLQAKLEKKIFKL